MSGCLPVLKWAGGKRRLLPHLLKHVPKKIDVYAEPFVGGGALFFEIHSRIRKQAILIDQNKDLVVFYRALRNKPHEVIAAANRWVYSEKTFYLVRSLDPKEMNDVERAARLLYLNKTCFNGLWRVNAKGRFNVPFGRYKNPLIVDEEALLAASKALQKATILYADFHVCERYDPDFVYCDPPYDVVSDTADFTRYAKKDFTWKDQKRLAAWAAVPRNREPGCIMISNAATTRIKKLYAGWKQETVLAARAINSNVKKRGKVEELIIY